MRRVTLGSPVSDADFARWAKDALREIERASHEDESSADTSGLFPGARVRVVATSNVVLASGLAAGSTIDGVTVADGDTALLTGQTAPAENGVYTVPPSGAASRADGFDTYDAYAGAHFSVMEGTAKADTLWKCTSDEGGTIETTALDFVEVGSGFGSGDVDGPDGGVTDGHIALFDGTTGKQIKSHGAAPFSGAYADLSGKPTLGDAAAKNTGTTAGTVTAGDDSRITGAAQKASNLSDLASVLTARTNLKIVVLTAAAYAALSPPDADTIYHVTA